MSDTKEIKVDLFEPTDLRNHKFANILDPGSWQKLIAAYNEGKGKSMDELLANLVEGK